MHKISLLLKDESILFTNPGFCYTVLSSCGYQSARYQLFYLQTLRPRCCGKEKGCVEKKIGLEGGRVEKQKNRKKQKRRKQKKGRKGKKKKRKEKKGKERKGKERKGKERKERKGNEEKGKERKVYNLIISK